MRDLTPAGKDETRIGKIEDLMATPERRGKMVGERAVVGVRDLASGKERIETDWVIDKFDTETGVVTVNKPDERGRLLEGKISRETFLAMNFPRSDEMFFELERMRQKNLDRKAEKELHRVVEVERAFARGDIATVRKYFSEQAKDLEKRYGEEDNGQKDARKKALKDMEKIEKDLAKIERHRIDARGSERETDELSIIHSRQDLADAKKRFEEANLRLGAGHLDLNRLREFMAIIDQEIERRKKTA